MLQVFLRKSFQQEGITLPYKHIHCSYLVSIDDVVVFLCEQFGLTNVDDKAYDRNDKSVLKDGQYQVTSRDSGCETVRICICIKMGSFVIFVNYHSPGGIPPRSDITVKLNLVLS